MQMSGRCWVLGAKSMKPEKLSIYDLFIRERRYIVPLYQRAYVWREQSQWEPLWEDIERLAEACIANPNSGGNSVALPGRNRAQCRQDRRQRRGALRDH